MPIEIALPEEQAYGAFDQEKIKERKPVSFPRENSKIRSFSTLFYWAYAWSEGGGEIGIHPHQGFEIASFVLTGKIEHYDTKGDIWKPLEAGDAQIIRSGSGISHAERILKNSSIFQVWFDPGLKRTMNNPATYSDYKKDSFPKNKVLNGIENVVIGEGSPFELLTDVQVRHFYQESGPGIIKNLQGKQAGVFCLKGSLKCQDTEITEKSFFRVYDEKELTYESNSTTELFVIVIPSTVDYPLFINRHST